MRKTQTANLSTLLVPQGGLKFCFNSAAPEHQAWFTVDRALVLGPFGCLSRSNCGMWAPALLVPTPPTFLSPQACLSHRSELQKVLFPRLGVPMLAEICGGFSSWCFFTCALQLMGPASAAFLPLHVLGPSPFHLVHRLGCHCLSKKWITAAGVLVLFWSFSASNIIWL